MTVKPPIEFWYYASDGAIFGPAPRSELAALLASGQLPAETLVWRDGLSDWQSASVAFAGASPENGHPHAAAPTAHTPANRWVLTALGVVLPLVAIGLATSLYAVQPTAFEFSDPNMTTAFWAARLAAMLIAAGIAVNIWWVRASAIAAAGRKHLRRAGRLKALCITAAVLTACVAAASLLQMREVHDIALARASYAGFAMTYDPTAAAVRMQGTIGPQFAARLESYIGTHPNMRALFINSEGGLVDEAMRGARLIEPLKLEITVRDNCDSACLIVFAAGGKRRVQWDTYLGFHAISSIVENNEGLEMLIKKQAAESDDYLVKRGVSRSIVDETNRIGPDSLNMISAIELAEQGFVTELIDASDNFRTVPLTTAKWREVEYHLEVDNPPLAEILRAIRRSAPAELPRNVASLHPAISAETEIESLKIVRDLISRLHHKAIRAADNAAVLQFLQVSQDVIGGFVAKRDWAACNALVGDVSQTSEIPSLQRLQWASAVAGLVASASSSAWKDVGPGPTASHDYSLLKSNLDVAMLAEDVEPQGEGAPARSSCLRSKKMIDRIIEMEPAKAAAIFRFIDRYGSVAP